MPSVASMTGYAALDGKTLAGTVTAECRSVNSRFLDLQVRFPDELRPANPPSASVSRSASRAGRWS